MCDSANRIEAGKSSFAIARLTTGYVPLCATQYFRGYTIFATLRLFSEWRIDAKHRVSGRDGREVVKRRVTVDADVRTPARDLLQVAPEDRWTFFNRHLGQLTRAGTTVPYRRSTVGGAHVLHPVAVFAEH